MTPACFMSVGMMNFIYRDYFVQCSDILILVLYLVLSGTTIINCS